MRGINLSMTVLIDARPMLQARQSGVAVIVWRGKRQHLGSHEPVGL